MKKNLLLMALLIICSHYLQAQKLSAYDVGKLKHRSEIIIVQSQPDAKSFKKLNKKHPEDAAAFQTALDTLNQTLQQVVQDYFYWVKNPQIEVKTEDDLKDLKKDPSRSKMIIVDCITRQVQQGTVDEPIGSMGYTHAHAYTIPLEWERKKSMFLDPAIEFYFAENYPKRPFYQLQLPRELPDYANMALSFLYSRFMIEESYKNKRRGEIKKDIQANSAELKNKTLLLCKEWLSPKFDEAKAREDYGYSFKIISKEELNNILHNAADSNYAIAYSFPDVEPSGAETVEVNIPFIINLNDGKLLAYSNTATGDALKSSVVSFATRGIVNEHRFGNLLLTNTDMKDFAKYAR